MTKPEKTPEPFPWLCPNCGAAEVWPTKINYQAKMKYEGRSYEFEVPDLEVFECRTCGEQLFNIEADHKISAAFRAELGLLQPEQVREGRKALALSQKELADQLGVAEESISRWETGALIQSRVVDRSIRVYFGSAIARAGFKAAAESTDFGAQVRFSEETSAEAAPSDVASRYLLSLHQQVLDRLGPSPPADVDALADVVARYFWNAPPDELRRFHAWIDPRVQIGKPLATLDDCFVSTFVMGSGPIDRLTQPLSRFGRCLEDLPIAKVEPLINEFGMIMSILRDRGAAEDRVGDMPDGKLTR